jgi:hypothetical protein
VQYISPLLILFEVVEVAKSTVEKVAQPTQRCASTLPCDLHAASTSDSTLAVF